jgi:hypothetical protein
MRQLNNSLLEAFFPNGKTCLKVYLHNFPHLIGISKNFLGNTNNVIEHIMYDYKLIDDFYNDSQYAKTDLEKLEVFSWIIPTLYNPSWIIDGRTGILAENFNSDIVFIKWIYYPTNYKKNKKYSYHVVGLDYIEKENFFIIKSQFPVKTKNALKKKFSFKEESLLFEHKGIK